MVTHHGIVPYQYSIVRWSAFDGEPILGIIPARDYQRPTLERTGGQTPRPVTLHDIVRWPYFEGGPILGIQTINIYKSCSSLENKSDILFFTLYHRKIHILINHGVYFLIKNLY